MFNKDIYNKEDTGFACIEYMKEEEENNLNLNKIKSDVEIILEALKEEDYYLAKLKVGNEDIYITLEDIFYLGGLGEFITDKVFNTTGYNYEDYSDSVDKLSKTKIIYLNDGLMIKNYGKPQYSDSNYYYPETTLYIRYDAIITIKPIKSWEFDFRNMKDELEIFTNYMKQPSISSFLRKF